MPEETATLTQDCAEVLPEVTVVTIGETQYILTPCSARIYLEYNTWLRSNPAFAEDFLLKSIYTIEGLPLPDLTLALISGRQKQKLLRVISSFEGLVTIHDDAEAFEDSENFSVGTLKITAKPIPSSEFSRLRMVLAGGASKAIEEFALKYYEVGGDPITLEAIELPYPEGIGFTAMAAIATHLISPLVPSQPTQI